MDILLAHDSFTQLGGAERVFLELANMFPRAPIYTLVADKKIIGQLPASVRDRIRTSPLQLLYRVYPRFQHLLPFIPLALRLTHVPKCDVVLSSSSAFVKGLRKPARATHINYCHTPTRFLWTDAEYVVQEVPWIVRWPARLFLWWMKRWDLAAARRVDVFVANSQEVQTRIQKFYHRDSTVVYPFVDMEFWHPSKARQAYFLIAGRLHAHKHNDLVIEACNELGLNLHVVGSGRDEAHLQSIAGPSITFLGRVSDEVLRTEYAGARGYIFPQVEDFGLMPVEAAACGTATIGPMTGGTKETIVPGKTGEWFRAGDKAELKRILQNWDERTYSIEALREHAQKFNKESFVRQIRSIVSTYTH